MNQYHPNGNKPSSEMPAQKNNEKNRPNKLPDTEPSKENPRNPQDDEAT